MAPGASVGGADAAEGAAAPTARKRQRPHAVARHKGAWTPEEDAELSRYVSICVRACV